MAWLVAGAVGVLGLLIGSFLNVVVHRVPRGLSVVRPGSHCPTCQTPIRPHHNLPVLGWLLLRGHCAHCREPISARYPMVELGTAAAFALVAWRFESRPWLLPAYLAFAALAIALALIDIEVRRLPNVLVLPAYPVLLALLAPERDSMALLRGVSAGLALFGFFVVIALLAPQGMGMGDVKLAGLIGVMLGYLSWGAVLTGAFLAFALGALYGVALIALRGATRRTAVPFGPFLLLGAWASILGASGLGEAYLRALGR